MKLLLIILLFLFSCNGEIPVTDNRLWTKGIIPYTMDGFSVDEEDIILNTMSEWEFKTLYVIQFIEKVEQDKYLSIKKGCENSFKSNNIIFDGQKLSKISKHEIGHALGLKHEHQRPDRDKYIKLICYGYYSTDHDFKKLELTDYIYNPLNYEYNYDSIMHYPLHFFMILLNESKVITEPHITETDAQIVIDMYSN